MSSNSPGRRTFTPINFGNLWWVIAALPPGIIVAAIAIIGGFNLTGEVMDVWDVVSQRVDNPVRSSVATVGHNDASGKPTVILAINVGSETQVIEFPGANFNGSPRILATITNYGRNPQRVASDVRLEDINGDAHPDLVIYTRGVTRYYVNKDGTFIQIPARPSTTPSTPPAR